MNRKQWIIWVLVAFFVGGIGSIFVGRFLIPRVASLTGWQSLNGLVTNSPIVINRTTEVQLNDGVNLIELIKQSGKITVGIYGSKNEFLGNGLIVTSDGLIFTANSLLLNQAQVSVTTNDGSKYPAVIQSKDPKAEIGILKIQASGLPVGQFDNAAELQPGQRVVYMGRSNTALEHQVMAGFVTESLANQLTTKSIMTDAMLNNNYVGAPIVNLSGHVVGITISPTHNIISENIKTALDQYLSKSQ